jgi:tRNA G18 (ribose-2'-O)-methylase SpoU
MTTPSSRSRGFFAVGVEHTKNEFNIGTLWRTADLLGAAFIFTIGRRYRTQASDTMKTARKIPLFNYPDFEDFYAHLPHDAVLVGIELADRAQLLADTIHPERAVYLLGAEDHGLSNTALKSCQRIVQLPGRASMNVAVAGSIVIYDRVTRMSKRPLPLP